MLVRMVVARAWQDAGRERQLDRDATYDVPDVVGRALVREGSAVIPPMRAPETKAGRARV